MISCCGMSQINAKWTPEWRRNKWYHDATLASPQAHEVVDSRFNHFSWENIQYVFYIFLSHILPVLTQLTQRALRELREEMKFQKILECPVTKSITTARNQTSSKKRVIKWAGRLWHQYELDFSTGKRKSLSANKGGCIWLFCLVGSW